MFSVLRKAEHIGEQSLRITQGMIDSFARTQPVSPDSSNYWTLIYLKERYCDQLYHTDVANDTRKTFWSSAPQRARALLRQDSTKRAMDAHQYA